MTQTMNQPSRPPADSEWEQWAIDWRSTGSAPDGLAAAVRRLEREWLVWRVTGVVLSALTVAGILVATVARPQPIVFATAAVGLAMLAGVWWFLWRTYRDSWSSDSEGTREFIRVWRVRTQAGIQELQFTAGRVLPLLALIYVAQQALFLLLGFDEGRPSIRWNMLAVSIAFLAVLAGLSFYCRRQLVKLEARRERLGHVLEILDREARADADAEAAESPT
jgi:membrane associated rhomboid family serine protease